MRLTDHTDYSLRVLMHLNKSRQSMTLDELAKTLKISRNNLIKVSHQLAKFGFIETTRGRAGGIRIKPETGQLSLKDIIIKTEESLDMADCFSNHKSTCTFMNRCRLKKSLNDALVSFFDTLGKTTLDDVT